MSNFGELQTNHTPAFVRQFCTQKFMGCTAILDQIILGGVELSEAAAKAMADRGATVQGNVLVASVTERLKAIEMYGKFGPGIRTDHRIDDGPPRRSVVLMPPWDSEKVEEAEYEDVTPAQGALPSGTGDEAE